MLMSTPEAVIKLSTRARQDFIDILRYTGETWGQQQLHVYRSKLGAALRDIARNPALGRHRDDLPDTHRGYLAGEHVIVYLERGSEIGVVRILHQRMSLMRHLSNRK